jgi:hypothetical protein
LVGTEIPKDGSALLGNDLGVAREFLPLETTILARGFFAKAKL